MLSVVDDVDEVVLVVPFNVITSDKYLTEATIEANEFSVAIPATDSSIVHSRCKVCAQVPVPL